MKKILLVVGLAFGCSSVYAQVTQVGNGNTNTITNDNIQNPLSNLSLTQFYGNMAEGVMGPDLLAPGQELTTTIRQRNVGAVSPSLYNFYRIMQSGSGNDIVGDQFGYNNRASVTQMSTTTEASATTSQSGWNNGAIIRQTAGTNYVANIRQGAVIPGGVFDNPPTNNPPLPNTFRNTAELTQEGQSGTATIVQEGSYSQAYAVQRGGTPFQPNTLSITQDNLSRTDVVQDGVGNDIDVNQLGWQYARVEQGAATVRNKANIDQGANRLEDTKNTARIFQNQGDGNQATIDQSDSRASRNYAQITQDGTRDGAGDPSTVTVTQTSKSGRVFVTQDEFTSGSTVDITQSNSRPGDGSWVEVNQSGRDNDFNVGDQDGSLNVIMGTQGGIDNTTDVDQEGQKNTATVNQNGSDNNIDINQENEPSSGVGNMATATQGANTSDGGIDINQNTGDGDANVATVNQTRGDKNQANIDQYEENTATVTQSGTEYQPTGANSVVDIDQTISTSGTATVVQNQGTFGNTVDITQQRDMNTADVTQTSGRLNATTILQRDNENTATVTQGGNQAQPGGGTTPNTIDITQNGKVAQATVTQGDDTGGSSVVIDQNDSDEATVMQMNGEGLDVTITQTGANIGLGNVAMTDQEGEDNTLDIVQNGNENMIGGEGAAMQRGKDNTATLNQDGSNNMISMDQSGSDNDIVIEQDNEEFGTVGNQATATQASGTSDSNINIAQGGGNDDGDGNVATVDQTRGDNNTANITQLQNNTATVTQSGTEYEPTNTGSVVNIDQSNSEGGTATATQMMGTFGSTINITQSEEDNTATVTQEDGRSNTTDISQTDDGNNADVTQSGTVDAGSGNASAVVIFQDGKDGDIQVNQSANGGGILATQFDGNRNEQDLTQSGRANSIITFQNGDDNDITLDQSGQENVGNIAQSNLLPPTAPANGPSMHTATLTQSGTLNDAAIGQGGFRNTTEVTQSGQENFASTIQYGSDNEATTTQSALRNSTVNITQGRIADGGGVAAARGTRDANNVILSLAGLNNTNTFQSEGNVATVNQMNGTNSENQVVNLFQSGDFETATITQSGSNNNNRTVQAGEEDELTSTQSGSQGRVIVSQYGEETEMGNTATVNQTATSSNNTVDIGQIKFDNVATVTQRGHNNNLLPGSIVRQVGERNTTTINQDGDRGNVAVIQGDLTGPLAFGGMTLNSTGYDPATNDAFGNTATVRQGTVQGLQALDNIVGIVQSGDNGMATATQDGTNNTIGIRQLNVGAVRSIGNMATALQETGTDNNLIDIEQAGQQNNATANQTMNVARSRINLNQRKDNNVATLTQSQGDDNVINVKQTPDNFDTASNTVTMSQAGSDNEARLLQTGYDNTLTLTQNGDGHLLRQNGGVGNEFALQGGHGNDATLSQTGNDHTINFNQSGVDNVITITQTDL